MCVLLTFNMLEDIATKAAAALAGQQNNLASGLKKHQM